MSRGKPYRERIGEKFGKLTIIEYVPQGKRPSYLCSCECGKTKVVTCDNLLYGITKSCGCARKDNFEDLSGKRFGKLTVIKPAENINEYLGNKKWLCKCDCGRESVVRSNYLKNGHTTSCGCLQRERVHEARFKHGDSNNRLFNIYEKIKRRCYNPKDHNYKEYGGRGIRVCNEWLDKDSGYINFKTWALSNGYKEDLSIDRIDVNGNYEPCNCRWATFKIQANNKRCNRRIVIDGVEKTAAEWADYYSIPVSRIYYRLKRNRSVEDIKVCLIGVSK